LAKERRPLEITGPPGRKDHLKNKRNRALKKGAKTGSVPGNDCVKKAVQFVDLQRISG
jgi:hypothetical protein